MYKKYTILLTFTNKIQFHISQNTQLCEFIGPLMEPKPKLSAYRNVVHDPIIM